jgi:23S rRNA pseudouridine955/2504/2580 synthase
MKRNFKFSKLEEEQGLIKRVALHAYKLNFDIDGKVYDVIAPYPKDMDVLIKLFDKHDS